jgi:hypothetical protein
MIDVPGFLQQRKGQDVVALFPIYTRFSFGMQTGVQSGWISSNTSNAKCWRLTTSVHNVFVSAAFGLFFFLNVTKATNSYFFLAGHCRDPKSELPLSTGESPHIKPTYSGVLREYEWNPSVSG